MLKKSRVSIQFCFGRLGTQIPFVTFFSFWFTILFLLNQQNLPFFGWFWTFFLCQSISFYYFFLFCKIDTLSTKIHNHFEFFYANLRYFFLESFRTFHFLIFQINSFFLQFLLVRSKASLKVVSSFISISSEKRVNKKNNLVEMIL